MVTFSWVCNESGLRLPCKRITEEVHALRGASNGNKPLWVHADGAQVAGNIAVDLEDSGVDSFSASFHKWPCGPKMTGLLYMKPEMAQQLEPNNWGYDPHIETPQSRQRTFTGRCPSNTNLKPAIDQDSYRFQYQGQMNDATLAAIGEMAQHHMMIGPSRIESLVNTNLGTAVDAINKGMADNLREREYNYTIPFGTDGYPAKNLSAGILILQIKGATSTHYNNVVRELAFNGPTIKNKKHRNKKRKNNNRAYAISNVFGLRLSTHFYLTKDYIDDCVDRIFFFLKKELG